MKLDTLSDVLDNCTPIPWTGCWLWDHGCSSAGYAMARLGGVTPSMVYMHRHAKRLQDPLSFQFSAHVLHSCDTPMCVNPNHLFFGTNLDNIRDRDIKGRNYWKAVTHCAHGHEYTEENTLIRKCKSGFQRKCRACNNAAKNDWAKRARSFEKVKGKAK